MRTDAQGWLSSNALRSYPFKENAFRVPVIAGLPALPVPTGVIVDLLILTPYALFKEVIPGNPLEHLPPTFKLKAILRESDKVTFVFSERFTNALVDEAEIAEVVVDLASFEELVPYKLTGITAATHGVIIFGKDFLPYVNTLGVGVYTLEDSDGYLEERTVRDNPYARVTSVSDLARPTIPLVGDVKLEEGCNIRLEPIVAQNGIRISAIPGTGELGRCCGPRGCTGTVPDILLDDFNSPSGWIYKNYTSTPIPPGLAAFYATNPYTQAKDPPGPGFVTGVPPEDYFEETFDVSDYIPTSLPLVDESGKFALHTEVVVRKSFTLTAEQIKDRAALINVDVDDIAEVYWNGASVSGKIGEGAPILGQFVDNGLPVPSDGIQKGVVPNSMLRVGENEVVVRATDPVGVSASLNVRVTLVEEACLQLDCESIVPYGSVWKVKDYDNTPVPPELVRFYSSLSSGPGHGFVTGVAPEDYYVEGFNDSGFLEARAPFFEANADNLFPKGAKHIFNTNSELVVRKLINIPLLGRRTVEIGLRYDNLVEVYWNETPLTPLIGTAESIDEINCTRATCSVEDALILYVPHDLVREGDNLLAIRAVDHGSEAMLDARVTLAPDPCLTAVYTIDGIPADAFGNFTFYGDNGVTVRTETNTVIVGLTLDGANLCEREGDLIVGQAGPQGAAGPMGPRGNTPDAECEEVCPCPECGQCIPCPDPNELPPTFDIMTPLTEDPCA